MWPFQANKIEIRIVLLCYEIGLQAFYNSFSTFRYLSTCNPSICFLARFCDSLATTDDSKLLLLFYELRLTKKAAGLLVFLTFCLPITFAFTILLRLRMSTKAADALASEIVAAASRSGCSSSRSRRRSKRRTASTRSQQHSSCMPCWSSW